MHAESPKENLIRFRIVSRTINIIPLFLDLQAAMSVHASAFPISTRKSHNGFHLSPAQKKAGKLKNDISHTSGLNVNVAIIWITNARKH